MEHMHITRYPAYKNSGVKWLGKIPAEWEILAFKRVFTEVYRYPTYYGIEYVPQGVPEIRGECLSNGMITMLNDQRFISESTNSRFPRTILKEGDIVMSVRGTMGKIGVVERNFAGANITANLLRLSTDQEIMFPYYLRHFMMSDYFQTQLDIASPQTTIKTITMPGLLPIPITVPPLAEQTRIADFLDRKTAQIDTAIAQKERLIALLHERRQILIHNTVTRGLNPDAPMKDSGVEWIREIPAHWKIKRVKDIFRLVAEPAPKDNDFELLSIYTDIGVKPRKELEERGNKASTTDGYWLVEKGDFIVNKLLAWMGAIGLSDYDGVTSPAYDILRPKREIVGNYFHMLFRTKSCSSELKRHSRGIMEMRLRLYFDKFGAIYVPFPSVKEQQAISEYIEAVTIKTEAALTNQQAQIEKLKEYKATLINSAVTGKIQV